MMIKSMRMDGLFSIIIAAMLLSGSFLMLAPTAAAKTAPTIADPEPLDLGYKIRQQTIDLSLILNDRTESGPAPNDHWIEGDVALYLTSMCGKSAWMPFNLRASGEYCELWTANDMLFSDGDPRNEFTSRLTITDEQVNYMVEQFDSNIYIREKEYFSAPPPLNGSGGLFEQMGCPESQLFRAQTEGKTMIMVFNIVDENYWEPSYPYSTIGYFSPLIESGYARNVIHIDVWDWANRTGPQTAGVATSSPYLYEMGIAHE